MPLFPQPGLFTAPVLTQVTVLADSITARRVETTITTDCAQAQVFVVNNSPTYGAAIEDSMTTQLIFFPGDTHVGKFTLTVTEDGVTSALDLTDSTVTISCNHFEVTGAIQSYGNLGKVWFTLPPEVTSVVPIGNHKYKIVVEWRSGVVQTVLYDTLVCEDNTLD